jgi:uncharacterized membrane protein YoaK (UPF0700 family)
MEYGRTPLKVDKLIELQLLFLTFSTGIQDAIAFPDFSCFASNQTGNSVLLAVGAARLSGSEFSIVNICISLTAFLLGALLTGQIGNQVGVRRRDWLFLNHALQTALVLGSAIILSVTGFKNTTHAKMASLALLAFSSGAQVASMRPMRIPEITTAMATAAWIDLVIDPGLVVLRNRPRDLRGMFLLALVGGSFVGAFMYNATSSWATLLLSGMLKLGVTISLLLNHAEGS